MKDVERSSSIRAFTRPKMAALIFLGFASGLPFNLIGNGKAFQAWMTASGVDLTKIGLFSLVGLPYSLKFLWSPILDRYVPPMLGRRRGWLLFRRRCGCPCSRAATRLPVGACRVCLDFDRADGRDHQRRCDGVEKT